jgi:cytochrome c biogenesis protein CcdA
VLSLVVLVVSIGFADSLNPSTLGPALLYALGQHPRRDVAEFTLGVFAVSTAGGLLLLLGPGRYLARHVHKPTPHTIHVVELIAGFAVLALAAILWLVRHHLRRPLARRGESGHRSALALGCGIMAVELPTAFPYFAAVAAIVGAHGNLATQILLLLLYNAVFVAPLVAVLGLVVVAGERGAAIAEVARAALQQHLPVLLPATLGIVGAVLILLGAVGLAR